MEKNNNKKQRRICDENEVEDDDDYTTKTTTTNDYSGEVNNPIVAVVFVVAQQHQNIDSDTPSPNAKRPNSFLKELERIRLNFVVRRQTDAPPTVSFFLLLHTIPI